MNQENKRQDYNSFHISGVSKMNEKESRPEYLALMERDDISLPSIPVENRKNGENEQNGENEPYGENLTDANSTPEEITSFKIASNTRINQISSSTHSTIWKEDSSNWNTMPRDIPNAIKLGSMNNVEEGQFIENQDSDRNDFNMSSDVFLSREGNNVKHISVGQHYDNNILSASNFVQSLEDASPSRNDKEIENQHAMEEETTVEETTSLMKKLRKINGVSPLHVSVLDPNQAHHVSPFLKSSNSSASSVSSSSNSSSISSSASAQSKLSSSSNLQSSSSHSTHSSQAYSPQFIHNTDLLRTLFSPLAPSVIPLHITEEHLLSSIPESLNESLMNWLKMYGPNITNMITYERALTNWDAKEVAWRLSKLMLKNIEQIRYGNDIDESEEMRVIESEHIENINDIGNATTFEDQNNSKIDSIQQAKSKELHGIDKNYSNDSKIGNNIREDEAYISSNNKNDQNSAEQFTGQLDSEELLGEISNDNEEYIPLSPLSSQSMEGFTMKEFLSTYDLWTEVTGETKIPYQGHLLIDEDAIKEKENPQEEIIYNEEVYNSLILEKQTDWNVSLRRKRRSEGEYEEIWEESNYYDRKRPRFETCEEDEEDEEYIPSDGDE